MMCTSHWHSYAAITFDDEGSLTSNIFQPRGLYFQFKTTYWADPPKSIHEVINHFMTHQLKTKQQCSDSGDEACTSRRLEGRRTGKL